MNGVMVEFPPIIAKAMEVIAGVYGTGEARKKKLEAEGYNYSKVQNCVNDINELFKKYGD